MDEKFNSLIEIEQEFIKNIKDGLEPARREGYEDALREQEKQILGLTLLERELLRVEIRNDCKKIRDEIKLTEEAYLSMHRSINWVALIVVVFGVMIFGIILSGCWWLLLLMPFYLVAYLITDRLYAGHLASKMYDLFWGHGYLEGSEFLADYRSLSANEINDLPKL